ncbi:nitrous oxide reductase accessory protein NosL [Aromatoleum sp.]|uniref:nitrous oxide reductase accessory protein NosL n=1 Tax=Aromatoleum sp. TaxID=2307007 RepID=UPI003FA5BE7D
MNARRESSPHPRMNPLRNPLLRNLLVICFAATLLAACGKSEQTAALVPVEIDRSTSCSLDGMLLADYPGPKAQIHYADQSEPEFFCDTVEMFSVYLKPEQVRPVRALFVQDMGKADWNEPKNNWIDAKNAWYVHGSSRHGSMGPTIASFALEGDAQKFAAEHGGKVLAFADVTPGMAATDGGALHDKSM